MTTRSRDPITGREWIDGQPVGRNVFVICSRCGKNRADDGAVHTSCGLHSPQVEQAERDAAVLAERAERLLMSYTARYEQDADEFYRATGFMAPGRSVPMAMGGYDEDQRQAEWDKWIAEQQDLFRWALLAGAAALRREAARRDEIEMPNPRQPLTLDDKDGAAPKGRHQVIRTLKDQTADRLRDAIHALRAIADGEDHVMGATELEAIALSSLTALLQSEAQTLDPPEPPVA